MLDKKLISDYSKQKWLGLWCLLFGLTAYFVVWFPLLFAKYDDTPSLDNDQLPNGLMKRGNLTFLRCYETFDMRLPFGAYEETLSKHFAARLERYKFLGEERAFKVARYLTAYEWLTRNRAMSYAASFGKPAVDYVRGKNESLEFWTVPEGNNGSYFVRPVDNVWKVFTKEFKLTKTRTFYFYFGWEVYNPTQQFKEEQSKKLGQTVTYWAVPVFSGRTSNNR